MTPDDVARVEFREQRKGYDTAAVDQLLERVVQVLAAGSHPGDLLSDMVLPTARRGYHRDEVDAFLERLRHEIPTE
jgi:DivIVA domain-containing protein